MPQVATTVVFSDKEIKDILIEKAKELLPKANLGGSSISIGQNTHDNEISASISFQGTQRS